jgi:hypothetical protein
MSLLCSWYSSLQNNRCITHGPDNDTPSPVGKKPFSIAENMIAQIVFLSQPNSAGLTLYPNPAAGFEAQHFIGLQTNWHTPIAQVLAFDADHPPLTLRHSLRTFQHVDIINQDHGL